MQRFSTAADATSWTHSESYQQLIEELKKFSRNGSCKTIDEPRLTTYVTEVFVTEVVRGKDAVFREWIAKIHKIEASVPGFRGIYVQAPQTEKSRCWITLLQFDTPEHLDTWLKSDEQKALLKESAPLITSLESHRLITSYEGWFASFAETGALPPTWKQGLVVLLVLFPIVMLEKRYLSPYLTHLSSSFGTFISNAVSVALLTFPMMPLAEKALRWWLVPNTRKEGLGVFTIVTCYLLEMYLLRDVTT